MNTVAEALHADLLQQHLTDAILLLDTAANIVRCNCGAQIMFQYTETEACGRNWFDLLIPNDALPFEYGRWDEMLKTGAVTYETSRRRKDGNLVCVDVTCSMCPPSGNGSRYVLASHKDVTDIRVMRDARLIDARFGDLLEAMPDGVAIVNVTGRIVLANTQMSQLFGYERHTLRGKPVEILMPQRFRQSHVSHRAGFSGQPRARPMGRGLELFGLREDGSEFPIEISLNPLETEEGVLISCAIRDITARKQIESALSEKNAELERAAAAKNRFLATMSHELRTPLNAIIGFTDTLLMRLPGPLTADQDEHLHIVQASGRHLLSLINDLLDLVKIESGHADLVNEVMSGADVLRQVCATMEPSARAKGLVLKMDGSNDPSFVGDSRAVRQILLNLVNNAIKFTQSGHVLLRCRDVLSPLGGRNIAFDVEDTGCGIAADQLDRLFVAFSQLDGSTTRQHEGAGLGLHLSREIARSMQGDIKVLSTPGVGSCFTLMLPVGDLT